MTDQRVDTAPRGFVRLVLNNGDTREVHGYGVDVEQVGSALAAGGQSEASRLGTLYFTLLGDSGDVSRPAEPTMQTIPVTRRVVIFDRIRYFNPNYALGSNPITITVLTVPRSAWTDEDPTGVARFRYLARSPVNGVTLQGSGGAGDAASIYVNLGQGEDRFWTDEEFDVRQYWHGMIVGDKAFEVYVETKLNAFDALRVWAQKFVAI